MTATLKSPLQKTEDFSSLEITFRNPPSEFRGTPFWCWNNRLKWEQLEPQIECFRKMGMGGFHIHVRTGLATPYLGREFMDMVKASVKKAEENGMLAWLYDEDRWPSGYGGGLVTREEKFRAKHLLFTCVPYGSGAAESLNASNALGSRNENGLLLARYEVVIRNGFLSDYRRLAQNETASNGGIIWHAYLETAKPVSWYNHQTYVDTLNAEATKRFIEVTHEVYAREVGEHFGKTIPAIFTDEPQFMQKTCFRSATDRHDLFLPFTTDLLETYAGTYGQRLEDHLPELFWELPDGKVSVARYRYHDHVCERFVSAYADELGKWCESHGLALTGHMMQEPTLLSQTASLGEAMRSYRAFQIPGIDILCDLPEYTAAKQAQSAVHQYGRKNMISEMYGVTGWDFDFVGHKGQGDWQAALGVTIRNHHLSWVSMAGEAKRDFPASIGPQSPWHDQYPVVEDHFARIHTVLTRGNPVVRIGVIHPIESYWLCCGPLEQTSPERQEREKQFSDLTHWLLFGLLDFDFICESLLPSQSPEKQSKQFAVGAMAYDVVIVPALRTIRSATLERLQNFAAAGGTVIFMGEIPTLMDAAPAEAPAQLAARCHRVDFTQTGILRALEPFRELEAHLHDGRSADALLSQLREDKESRFLFVCNTDRVGARNGTVLKMKGKWSVTHLDTLTGKTEALACECKDGWTLLSWDFPGCGSLLLRLDPGWHSGGRAYAPQERKEVARLASPVPVTLSEPNVLLLDQAEWRIDNEAWRPSEEILRLDNLVRRQLNLPDRTGNIAQPWTDREDAPTIAQVELRFRIESRVAVSKPQLALEEAAKAKICWNGQSVPSRVQGWWVDEAIETVCLPAFEPGVHELIIRLPFDRKTNIENCYLLGDFGVRVLGRRAHLVAPVRQLDFGDWTQQGLPFYVGNVTYHCPIAGMTGQHFLQVPRFKNPLLSVVLDENSLGAVAFPPFENDLGDLSPKGHTLHLTAYGNRFNAFGAVHNCDPALQWHGPGSYRSEGVDWCYEYQLKPMGILSAPLLLDV